MYDFPTGLYTDVRIEDVFETSIQVTLGEVEERKEKAYRAAFVRVYDGQRWYYAATSDLDGIQAEIDELAAMASPQPAIAQHPVVRAF
jgi:TldD protein